MNIFFLDKLPYKAAEYHCDKHVTKMILEYAQLLSTAHRVVDGTMYYGTTKNGRRIKRWLLPDEREHILYKATHYNHPSAVWVRENTSNYRWLFDTFLYLLMQFLYRNGKEHKTTSLLNTLRTPPKALGEAVFTPPPACMPAVYVRGNTVNDTVESYREFYRHDKSRFATWKNVTVPSWYTEVTNV